MAIWIPGPHTGHNYHQSVYYSPYFGENYIPSSNYLINTQLWVRTYDSKIIKNNFDICVIIWLKISWIDKITYSVLLSKRKYLCLHKCLINTWCNIWSRWTMFNFPFHFYQNIIYFMRILLFITWASSHSPKVQKVREINQIKQLNSENKNQFHFLIPTQNNISPLLKRNYNCM